MLLPAAHSRRALVASATARKGKGKKKKKKPAPLAFTVVTVTELGFSPDPTFTCTVSGAWMFHDGLPLGTFDTDVEVVFGAESQVRAKIVAALQELVSAALEGNDEDVPADRIAVTLLQQAAPLASSVLLVPGFQSCGQLRHIRHRRFSE